MHLTVIPSDKQIYLETSDLQYPNRRCHIIDNDSEFWNSVDSRINAIQYHSDGLKQIEYNNQTIMVVENDYRKIDFQISTPIISHRFKVSTTTGVSFTLPEGTTEKHTLPVYAELSMGLLLVDEDCYFAYEHEKDVLIKKTLSCSIREFFSF